MRGVCVCVCVCSQGSDCARPVRSSRCVHVQRDADVRGRRRSAAVPHLAQERTHGLWCYFVATPPPGGVNVTLCRSLTRLLPAVVFHRVIFPILPILPVFHSIFLFFLLNSGPCSSFNGIREANVQFASRIPSRSKPTQDIVTYLVKTRKNSGELKFRT